MAFLNTVFMNLTSEIHWKNTLNIKIRDETKLNATKSDLQIGRDKFAKYILIVLIIFYYYYAGNKVYHRPRRYENK